MEKDEVEWMLTYRILPMTLLILLVSIACYLDSVEPKKAYIWFDTWVCPNEYCKYENYESVDYCGICGTKKPIKSRRSHSQFEPLDIEFFNDVVEIDGHTWVALQLMHHPECPCQSK